jgi:hypothetical protein
MDRCVDVKRGRLCDRMWCLRGGSVGAAVADADLLGVGGGGGGIDVLGIDVLGRDVVDSAGKAGTGAAGAHARANSVSTAPSARSVVIRTKLPTGQADSTVTPAVATPIAASAAGALGSRYTESLPAAPPASSPRPLTAPMSIPPAAPVVRPPAPEAMPISPTKQSGPSRRIGPAGVSPPVRVADSFRVGYAEHLRSATTSDIFAAAVPGVAGIAGFTLLGAFAGYRQAKACTRRFSHRYRRASCCRYP